MNFIQSGESTEIRAVKRPYLLLADFGIELSSGRDQYSALINLLDRARSQRQLIFLPGGEFLRVFEKQHGDGLEGGK